MNALKPVEIVAALKAAGEHTRLRLLVLLARGEHNVKDLTRILGQSQPRVSRHLKLLYDAGLIERFQEGSWVYFRLCESGALGALVQAIVANFVVDDADMVRDEARAVEVLNERELAAQEYFKTHAGEWDAIRALHIAEVDVEAAILEKLAGRRYDQIIDVGTGTGRIVELLAANCERAIGFDINQDMLAYARAKLEQSGNKHCQVRLGNIYNLPLDDGSADLVVVHQVLHFLDDPARAIREAGRLCAPDGQVLIVDFAPHELEYLREDHAHRRLGFAPEQIERWFDKAGLKISSHSNMAHGDLTRGRTQNKDMGKNSDKDSLTVSLWMGDQKNKKAGTKMNKTAQNLEVAG